MTDEKIMKGTVKITDRKNISIDGVNNIEGFDESYISLSTDLGRVVIEGRGLKVESLSKEDGIIFVAGHINGVFYTEQKSSKNILSRIFG